MFNQHVVNAIKNHQLVNDSTLHVIGVISNSARYHSRYRIFRDWYAKMSQAANVQLYIVELAFGDRHFEVTDSTNPNHLQLRTSAELWHKENMINLGTRLLPRNWRYLAWVDCDVFFSNSNWALETIHELQHYDLVQPYSDCLDLGVYGNVTQLFRSFGSLAKSGVRMQTHPEQKAYQYGHSGFAWACTRKYFENIGGLIDFAILGSADHHMAWGSVGHIDWSIHAKMSQSFKDRCHEWQRNALRVTNGHISYIPGRIEHMWHGQKKKRYYRERWQILVDNKFDPNIDLRYDSQGLIQLVNKPHLENDIRNYLRSRHEDSVDEE